MEPAEAVVAEIDAKPLTTGESDQHHHDSEEYESAESEDDYAGDYADGEVEGEEDDEVIHDSTDEAESETEGKPPKELDGDQDKKNPQFIPKKGYFYEHDVRRKPPNGHGSTEEPKEEKEKNTVKVPDRWQHDMYNETEQGSKTREDLIAAYGYDIRTEEQPPRARRRRRYGRGPNTYTRKWEEEEEYQKPRRGFGSRGRGGWGDRRNYVRRSAYDEDFPELEKDEDTPQKTDTNINKSIVQDAGSAGKETERQPRDRQPLRNVQKERHPNGRQQERDYRDRRDGDFGRGGGRGQGRGRGRSRGGRRNEFSNRNRYPDRFNKTSDADFAENVDRKNNYQERKDRREPNGSSAAPVPKPKFQVSQEKQQPQEMERRSFKEPGNTTPPNKREMGNLKPNKPVSSMAVQSEPVIEKSSKITANEKLEDDAKHDNRDRWAGYPSLNSTNDRRGPTPQLMQQHSPETSTPPPVSTKPKKFSAQRQRQVEPPTASLPPPVSAIPPVVSSGGRLVPSPIPGYGPSPNQTYYEAAPSFDPNHVYEASGSPVTVSGPSVSPSMWGPHTAAYAAASHVAAAPYPSPPTAGQVAQAPYSDPAAYIAAAPSQAAIYAPPTYIQDPNLMNYAAPQGTPYVAPYQGYQPYPNVAPAPPPELYHGGVTYYNPQNQLQRPPIVVQQKRTKTVLQLVEPPEKAHHVKKDVHHVELHPIEESLTQTIHQMSIESQVILPEMEQTYAEETLQPPAPAQPNVKSASPAPIEIAEPESWAEQMDEATPYQSPTTSDAPEVHSESSPDQSEIPSSQASPTKERVVREEQVENEDEKIEAEVKVEKDEGQ